MLSKIIFILKSKDAQTAFCFKRILNRFLLNLKMPNQSLKIQANVKLKNKIMQKKGKAART